MSRGTGASLVSLLRLRNAADMVSAAEALQRVEAASGMIRVLEQEGALIWFHRRLHDLSLTPGRDHGAAIRSAALQEHVWASRVEEGCHQVFGLLDAYGIPCIAIKGPARRIAADRYPYADARMTSDVDLLIPANAAAAARDMLAGNGYERVYPGSLGADEHFHLPTVRRPGGIAVELHLSTDPWTPPEMAWERQMEGSSTIRWRGYEVRIPSATELLWHSVAHAFIDGAEGFRLRTFLDGAVIIAADVAIDWDLIRQRIDAAELQESERERAVSPVLVRRWLATASHLAGAGIPEDLMADGRFAIERLLDWKLTVAAASLGRATRERLVEEAIRTEFAMPLTPSFRGDGNWDRVRRRLASRAARIGYLGWRLPQMQG